MMLTLFDDEFPFIRNRINDAINLKKWIGDSRACNNFSLSTNLPLSDIKSPI